MRKQSLVAGLTLIAALVLGSLPAVAHGEGTVVVTDGVGDANFVNANGNTNLSPPDGPDTRPASFDGADIREIAYRTVFDTIRIFDTEGNVERVTYVPTGLEVIYQMEGDVMPTFGPSLIWRVHTNIAGCDVWFHAVVRGSNPQAGDPHRAELRTPSATSCPAATTLISGFELSVSGHTVTTRFPFSALTGNFEGFLDPGTMIDPDGTFTNNANAPAVRVYGTLPGGGFLTAPTIDETARPQSFIVGEDVPAPVVCAEQPEHPDCTL